MRRLKARSADTPDIVGAGTPTQLGLGIIRARRRLVEISLKATSHLSEFVPETGRVNVEEGSKVEDVLTKLGIGSDLVMLIVVDGELGDIDSHLEDGAVVELIPPISGG
jgi:sulfur carrier protein ThiS